MSQISNFIQGIKHPEAFHGKYKTAGFFEGWYVKVVSKDKSTRIALIPGIFKGLKQANGSVQDEAFIQVLDGASGQSWYHKFDAASFQSESSKFETRVGGNRFDSTGFDIDLPGLRGKISFTTKLDPWPVTASSPGIMGWYGMVPFMECFHGVVSLGHSLSGDLEITDDDGQKRMVSFDGGRGYIEKDWGKAFPKGYVWIHTNHIEKDESASLVASVAIIPWLGSSFRGFIVGLKHGGKLYRFTTYNRAKERELTIDDHGVSWALEGKDGRLEIKAVRQRGGLLHAPLREAMHQRVEETLDAKLTLRHLSPTGEVLLESNADVVAMEVFGDLEKLLGIKN